MNSTIGSVAPLAMFHNVGGFNKIKYTTPRFYHFSQFSGWSEIMFSNLKSSSHFSGILTSWAPVFVSGETSKQVVCVEPRNALWGIWDNPSWIGSRWLATPPIWINGSLSNRPNKSYNCFLSSPGRGLCNIIRTRGGHHFTTHILNHSFTIRKWVALWVPCHTHNLYFYDVIFQQNLWHKLLN